MNIEDARKRIKELEDYIHLLESYEPETLEQEAIKLYAELENVTNVTKELNEKGYRIGQRKLVTTDVSKVLRSEPKDKLHVVVKKMLHNNRGRSQRRGWL